MSILAAADLQQPAMPDPRHEHGWRVHSRHATSTGWLLYVRCDSCRTWRVDRQGDDQLVPTPISKEVGA